MVGTGFCYAILPILRRVYRDDPHGLEAAIRRHAEHFNAHPYLAAMAIGAVGRMEKEGEDPETIKRFKVALRGPLGSLGDRLVWARWLPASGALGILAALLVPVWWVGPAVFFLVYNAGHLTLRTWAYRLGLREGRNLGTQIRRWEIGRRADILILPLALMVGLIVGTVLGVGIDSRMVPWPWLLPGAVLFAVGARSGERARNTATFVFLLALIALGVVGTVR
jgi:PTS system mannose-specific IID component